MTVRKAWEDIVRAWPILTTMVVVGVFSISWALGVDKFVEQHPQLVEIEKAQMVAELDERYMNRELLAVTLGGIEKELKRLADEVEKLRNNK